MRASARPRATHLLWAASISASLVGFAACADSVHIDLPDAGKTTTTSQGTGGGPGGCSSNASCTWPHAICDQASGSCVECLVNEDCAGKPLTVCSEGECRCPATPDAGTLTYCPALNDADARCVDTQTAATDCGACNHACFGACGAGKCGTAWSRIASSSKVAPRAHHVAVATTEPSPRMIVWGGQGVGGILNTGGIYDPATDTWTPMSTVGAPAGRRDATAVWDPDDKVMIVWGGTANNGGNVGGALDDGGVYDPATDTWSAINKQVAGGGSPPPARLGHTAVWATALGMIVFGGQGPSGPYYGDAFIYSPVSDTWTPITPASTSFPAGRKGHNAVWLGTQMVVFGGFGPDTAAGAYLGDLWTWDAANSWQTPGTQPSAAPRSDATAVVAGGNMIVWGGTNASPPVSDGFAFSLPGTYVPTANAPTQPDSRTGHSAVVIGAQMLVFGGKSASYAYDDTLWALDTASLGWAALKAGPERRAFHTAVAVGKKMIVFGGDGPNGLLANGAAYDTATP